jgi:hypothetical protein
MEDDGDRPARGEQVGPGGAGLADRFGVDEDVERVARERGRAGGRAAHFTFVHEGRRRPSASPPARWRRRSFIPGSFSDGSKQLSLKGMISSATIVVPPLPPGCAPAR